MWFLRRIKTTVMLWFDLHNDGYTLSDCWDIAEEIIDRARSYKTWKNWRDRYEEGE